jgi:hypothetical protein
MLDFMAGLITMGFLIAGLFFLRFWTRTRDPLFAAFAAAFWLLALGQGLTTLIEVSREEHSRIYLLRLLAFSLIIGAILTKNLSLRRPAPGPSTGQ